MILVAFSTILQRLKSMLDEKCIVIPPVFMSSHLLYYHLERYKKFKFLG
jgi:membrane protein CcdC involved in cytochrome C biogenesis